MAAQTQRRGRPTLGNPVTMGPTVGADLQGKWLGADTYVNRENNAFNTKQQVILSDGMAAYLNDQGSNPSGIPFTEDPDARIMVNPGGNPVAYVPGTNTNGTPFGLMLVRNPIATYRLGSRSRNRRGTFFRVGGPAYRQLVTSALQQATPLTEQQIDTLIGQGYRYGLAAPLQSLGISVNFSPDVNQHGGGVYSVQNRNNWDPSVIAQFYDANLKNPEQQLLGSYASASLARDWADNMTGADGQQLRAEDLIARYEQTGSVKGAFHYKPGLKASQQRAGRTAFPVRQADGTAIQGAVFDPSAGECNIYGSGPGVGGQGSDNFQLRLYKDKREHRAKTARVPYGSRADASRSAGAATYYCGPTRADYIDAERGVYQPGGARGGNVGLASALDQRSQALGRPDVSAAALAQRYQTWSNSAEIPPQFRAPSNTPGRGNKGGFGLFNAARRNVGSDQGRLLSYEQALQRADNVLPANYKGQGPRATINALRPGVELGEQFPHQTFQQPPQQYLGTQPATARATRRTGATTTRATALRQGGAGPQAGGPFLGGQPGGQPGFNPFLGQ